MCVHFFLHMYFIPLQLWFSGTSSASWFLRTPLQLEGKLSLGGITNGLGKRERQAHAHINKSSSKKSSIVLLFNTGGQQFNLVFVQGKEQGIYISGNRGRSCNREECNGSRGFLWNGRWYQRQTTYSAFLVSFHHFLFLGNSHFIQVFGWECYM